MLSNWSKGQHLLFGKGPMRPEPAPTAYQAPIDSRAVIWTETHSCSISAQLAPFLSPHRGVSRHLLQAAFPETRPPQVGALLPQRCSSPPRESPYYIHLGVCLPLAMSTLSHKHSLLGTLTHCFRSGSGTRRGLEHALMTVRYATRAGDTKVNEALRELKEGGRVLLEQFLPE